MSDDRTATAAFLDSVALGIVSAGLAGLLVIGIGTALAVSELATAYPSGMSAVAATVLFGWALWRVLARYRS